MATTGFTSEASSSYHTPHTPPYTPRHVKRPLSRNDSPASVRSAVQADATESPAKKVPKRQVPDEVKVEELEESDLGYIADNEIVYPNELEEAESQSASSEYDEDDTHHDGDVSSSEDDDITDPLSRLRCDDGEEAEFERKRRAKHVRRRTESRVFKRPHSLIINPESEVTDLEAMADQDLPESARRLRRRVRGPDGLEGSVESLGSSPLAEAIERAAGSSREGTMTGRRGGEPGTTDEMDVDDEE